MNIQKIYFYHIIIFASLSTTAQLTGMLTKDYFRQNQSNQPLNGLTCDEMDLHHAAGNDDNLMLTHLINRGVNINAKNLYTGNTALHEATLHGHVTVTNTLLMYGAKINEQNIHGDTSLHMVMYSQKSTQCLQLLIHHNASQKIKNNKQYCADHYLANQRGSTPPEGINSNKNNFIPITHATLLRERLRILQATGH